MILDRRPLGADALEAAEFLLGKLIRRGDLVLRISEVEAYRGPEDTASHSRMGMTPRNAPMFGPPGHAYVYLCYGVHHLVNVVTGPPGLGAAVLIRACEPVRGWTLEDPRSLAGPGKVGRALGVSTASSGLDLCGPGELTLLDAPPVPAIVRGPRVGVDYASPAHREAPWRLAIRDTPWVSHPRRLG